MKEFLTSLPPYLAEFLTYFIPVALLQNVILNYGFGSSIMLHTVKKPKTIWLFSGILGAFSLLTVLIAYPLDNWLFETDMTNVWRPLMLVGITALVYVAASLLLQWLLPVFYHRVSRLLPMAAFNNLVTGIALICNAHFNTTLIGNVGMALGAALSFGMITWLTAEGMERMDNPDMPEAFRGAPSTLLYVGLLALALMGFVSEFSLII